MTAESAEWSNKIKVDPKGRVAAHLLRTRLYCLQNEAEQRCNMTASRTCKDPESYLIIIIIIIIIIINRASVEICNKSVQQLAIRMR